MTAENNIYNIITELEDNLVILHTIYDSWGVEKKKILETTNRKIEVLWHREPKITRASDVRFKIYEDQLWEHLVPNTTEDIINEIGVNTK